MAGNRTEILEVINDIFEAMPPKQWLKSEDLLEVIHSELEYSRSCDAIEAQHE